VDFRLDIWTIDQWIGEPSNCAPEEHDALARGPIRSCTVCAWPTPDSRSCCTRRLMGRCEAMPLCRWGDRAPAADPPLQTTQGSAIASHLLALGPHHEFGGVAFNSADVMGS